MAASDWLLKIVGRQAMTSCQKIAQKKFISLTSRDPSDHISALRQASARVRESSARQEGKKRGEGWVGESKKERGEGRVGEGKKERGRGGWGKDKKIREGWVGG